MKRNLSTYALIFVVVLILAWCATAHCQTVAPFQGLGNVQFFDNSGVPLTAGVLYSFQAGTSTQQATFTDSTGLVQNPNPIPFGSGARVGIWLTSGALYKFVLCLQNDGAFCAPADVLFSVDQVPATSSGGGSGGGGSPFVGTFISGSATPATSGVIRLASGDTVCYRNTANSANLCWRKDSNDLLSWDGGSFKLPEVGAPPCSSGFDVFWADNTAHTFKACGNGGVVVQFVFSGADINTFSQVTQLHFASTGTPLSSTPPTTGQFLQWNGSNIIGNTPEIPWSGYVNTLAAGNTIVVSQSVLTQAHTLIRLGVAMLTAPSGCSPQGSVSVFDSTSSATIATALTLASGQITDDSGVLSGAMTAGHTFQIKMTQATGCAAFPANLNITAVYQ